jgi:hypothetical protein
VCNTDRRKEKIEKARQENKALTIPEIEQKNRLKMQTENQWIKIRKKYRFKNG